jgi:hypothetical protein
MAELNAIYDIVIIATLPDLRTIPAEELEAHLDGLFRKAGLYKTS